MADMTEAQVKILEKVIGDEEFRASFFDDPDGAVAKAGIEISEEEMAGIKAIDIARMKAAIADIDARISKSGVSAALDVEAGIKEAFEGFIIRKTR
jgi:hypothetical protein